MKKSTILIMSALVAASGLSMNAQRLWIAGDGVQAGWDLEKSTALLATTSNPDVHIPEHTRSLSKEISCLGELA